MATDHPWGPFRDPDDSAQQPEATGVPGPASPNATHEAEAFEAQAFLASVDSQIMAVKAELDKLLDRLCQHGGGVRAQAVQDANITGVGIGVAGTEAMARAAPGDPVLEVYTLAPEPHDTLCERLASVAGMPALADRAFPMHAVHTGPIHARQHGMRLRPAPGGISCGHLAITAGTLGCLVRGRSAPRDGQLLVLSNNHVLADSNVGPQGAAILQPGPTDGGSDPADRIAVLERFVPIDFGTGQVNRVDAATAWAWSERVRPELMHVIDGEIRYFRVGSTPVAAEPGLPVGKSGRTTALTRGEVTAIGATLNVNYGKDRVAHFNNQIAVRAAEGDFSAGGDSGSLIWTWDGRRAPVALLFAGGGGTTFGNPIASVLAALDVELVT